MGNNAQKTQPSDPPKALTRVMEFEGKTITAVYFRDRWVWPASQVGEAVYEHGRRIVDQIRGGWSEEFDVGIDFLMLTGSDLSEFQALRNDYTSECSHSRGRGGARYLMVLTASGIDKALMLSLTDKGRRLRKLLAEHILPQLRATGTATLPGAAPPAAFTLENLQQLLAAIVPQVVCMAVPEVLKAVGIGVPANDRLDVMEARVGRVEADVASGVIGPDVAEQEILIPLRLLSADPTNPGKLNVSRRMSFDKRLRNEVEFNGEDTRWEKLERVKLARAQRFIGRLMREADEGRRKAIRDAQTKAREAREKGKNQQTEIKSVIEFDPTRRRKRKPKLGA